MDIYSEKLKAYIVEKKITAEHLTFAVSCHSVADAARAVGGREEEFVKNICMIGKAGDVIVAILKGEDKVSRDNVAATLGIEKPKLATPEQILAKTGYPCGGTPSFGFPAIVLVDERVLEVPVVYSGGGSQQSLVKISSQELLQASKGRVARIRQ